MFICYKHIQDVQRKVKKSPQISLSKKEIRKKNILTKAHPIDEHYLENFAEDTLTTVNKMHSFFGNDCVK